ncbi:hypothetical protein [Streptomyces nigrescens]|uniref:hypothetical protein n=1 Tax=Streptomyces nigrescens TaxID=1920 RepID=UPI00367F83DE
MFSGLEKRRCGVGADSSLTPCTLSNLTNLAWLGGNAAALLTDSGTPAPYQPTGALLHPEQLWPDLDHTALLMGTRITPIAVLLALAAVGAWWWTRRKSASGGRKKPLRGLARKRDIEPLLAKAMTAKAQSLRPSLKDAKHIAPRETGDHGPLSAPHLPQTVQRPRKWGEEQPRPFSKVPIISGRDREVTPPQMVGVSSTTGL